MAERSKQEALAALSGSPLIVLDLTPATDVTYDGSSGFLVGDVPGGILEGVPCRSWGANLKSVVESAAGYVTIEFDETGQGYAYANQAYLTTAAGWYWEAVGDFDIYGKFGRTGAGDAQRSVAVLAGRLDDGGTLNSVVSMESLGWTDTSGKPCGSARGLSTAVALYTAGAAVADPIWLRIKRVGQTVTWEDSTDGVAWNTRITRTLDAAGSQCWLGVFFGGTGGAGNLIRCLKLHVEYHAP